MLKEVVEQRIPESEKTYGPKCPKCGARTVLSPIPCPDPPKQVAPGVLLRCLVEHTGWRCEGCGTCYTEDGK